MGRSPVGRILFNVDGDTTLAYAPVAGILPDPGSAYLRRARVDYPARLIWN